MSEFKVYKRFCCTCGEEISYNGQERAVWNILKKCSTCHMEEKKYKRGDTIFCVHCRQKIVFGEPKNLCFCEDCRGILKRREQEERKKKAPARKRPVLTAEEEKAVELIKAKFGFDPVDSFYQRENALRSFLKRYDYHPFLKFALEQGLRPGSVIKTRFIAEPIQVVAFAPLKRNESGIHYCFPFQLKLWVKSLDGKAEGTLEVDFRTKFTIL